MKDIDNTLYSSASQPPRANKVRGPVQEDPVKRARRIEHLKEAVAKGDYHINSDVLVYDILEALFDEE